MRLIGGFKSKKKKKKGKKKKKKGKKKGLKLPGYKAIRDIDKRDLSSTHSIEDSEEIATN